MTKKETPKVKVKAKKEPIKPYIHIDTFLQTAQPLYSISNIAIEGFRAHMEGQYYKRDEQEFLIAFKDYFTLK